VTTLWSFDQRTQTCVTLVEVVTSTDNDDEFRVYEE
jgi:hypothetical protein